MSALPDMLLYAPLPEADLPQWVEWLWGFGCDIVEMADILEIPEADVARMLHEVRGAVN